MKISRSLKMAENLNKVNMNLVYIFLFLSVFASVESKDELIPVLTWTSPDFQFYILGLLEDKKPTIVIFLEQVLGTDDFNWTYEIGNNSFPFLTELRLTSKLNYFGEIQAPHQVLTKLSKNGYSWKHFKSGQDLVVKEGDLFLREFRVVDGHRSEILKSHDEEMKKISQQLANSGKSWICVYTARHSNEKGLIPDKKLSSWYADEQFAKRPVKAVSLYHDEHTGFALITRGAIELHLPSLNNMTFKLLDNYLKASATFFQKKINFDIWFLNYKLTFYLNQENHKWMIQEGKIVNDNGDTLNLIQENEETPNKCYTHMAEFKSGENPKIKVKLLKYKFLKLPQPESCVKPYGVELMAVFIFFLIVFIVVFWNSVLENYDFSAESKASFDKILAFKFDAMTLT